MVAIAPFTPATEHFKNPGLGPDSSPMGIRLAPTPAPRHERPPPGFGPQERFQTEVSETARKNGVAAAWLILVLMPLCTVFDWLLYPHLGVPFLALRLLCSACCIPLLWALKTQSDPNWRRACLLLLPILPGAALAFMIHRTGDPACPYDAGLALCLIGAAFILPSALRDLAVVLAAITVFFLAATLPNAAAFEPVLTHNAVFLGLAGVAVCLNHRRQHAIRWRDFQLRCALEEECDAIGRRKTGGETASAPARTSTAEPGSNETPGAISRLSAGLLHEVNNPLNYLQMAVHVLKDRTRALPAASGAEIADIANDLDAGIRRIGSTIDDLRHFAFPWRKASWPVRLERAVAKALKQMELEGGALPNRVDAEVADRLVVLGDESMIVQVVVNLLRQSRAAQAGRADPVVEVRADEGPGEVTLLIRDNRSPQAPRTHHTRPAGPDATSGMEAGGGEFGVSVCGLMMNRMGGGIEWRTRPGQMAEVRVRFLKAGGY